MRYSSLTNYREETLNTIALFCGASSGTRPEYQSAARIVGEVLAESGITLVYGGSSIGLMGIAAEACLTRGGRVVGVIPEGLFKREVVNRNISELKTVGSMHERKMVMHEISDGVLVMPGGIGTLDEFFEVWTWAQLGLHAKPIGILNVAHYFTPLLSFLQHMVGEGFLSQRSYDFLLIDDSPEQLIGRLLNTQPGISPIRTEVTP